MLDSINSLLSFSRFSSSSSLLHKSNDSCSWFLKKSSWFFLLPNKAKTKPYPSFISLSLTLSTAALLFDTMATVSPLTRTFATIFNMVCVLPVPGGPWIILNSFSKTFLVAFSWLLLNLNGNTKGFLSLKVLKAVPFKYLYNSELFFTSMSS